VEENTWGGRRGNARRARAMVLQVKMNRGDQVRTTGGDAAPRANSPPSRFGLPPSRLPLNRPPVSPAAQRRGPSFPVTCQVARRAASGHAPCATPRSTRILFSEGDQALLRRSSRLSRAGAADPSGERPLDGALCSLARWSTEEPSARRNRSASRNVPALAAGVSGRRPQPGRSPDSGIHSPIIADRTLRPDPPTGQTGLVQGAGPRSPSPQPSRQTRGFALEISDFRPKQAASVERERPHLLQRAPLDGHCLSAPSA
jgi:hypothetical protein